MQDIIEEIHKIPIPQKVGQTALAVALVRYVESKKPENERLFYDPYAKYLTGGPNNQTSQNISEQTKIKMMQGIILRTRFIDEQIFEYSLKKEIHQIVILGAGMDCRALRIPFSSNHHVFEIDTEYVLNYKNTILEKVSKLISPSSLANRHCISVDFSTGASPWVKPLLESNFNPNKPTIWIMEGLLMYLDEKEIIELLETVSKLSAPKSRIIANHGNQKLNPDFQKKLDGIFLAHFKLISKEIGASFRSTYSFEGMKAFLESLGFADAKKYTHFDYGDWAVKRLEELKITRNESETGFYFITTEKI